MGLRIHLRIEDHLDNALSISQFNEDKTAKIPSPLNPSQESHLAVDILLLEIPAINAVPPYTNFSILTETYRLVKKLRDLWRGKCGDMVTRRADDTKTRSVI
jgi:hypothetical protein